VTAADSGVVTLTGGSPLTGEVRVPGDKSISHRALLLAALAEGTSTITGLSDGDDVRRTRLAVEALGADVVDGAGSVTVHGGRSRLHAPAGAVDLGNSGTGMRLLLGLLAGLPLSATLTGDASLSRRPMDRVAVPLGAMGATVTGRDPGCRPPVTVAGGHLRGITYTPPMASAQVKSAVLLAGLDADGATVVEEPVPTRAHTEEMLARMGADIEIAGAGAGAGRRIRLRRSRLVPVDWTVPGDPSQAAFWVVAGAVVPGSRITVADVHLGAERTGFVGVLQRMGAAVEVAADGELGTLTSRYAPLTGTVVEAEEIPSLDEVPILAVAAAVATGATRFRRVGELRVKESDRLAGTAALVNALGGRAHVDGDDLVVDGGGLGGHGPASVDAHGDHRMAMAAAVATAAGHRTTTVSGWEAVATSYPGFLADLAKLGGPS
jgi:3-phosphoshikimate 1-carboxyvinyltransferase